MLKNDASAVKILVQHSATESTADDDFQQLPTLGGKALAAKSKLSPLNNSSEMRSSIWYTKQPSPGLPGMAPDIERQLDLKLRKITQ